MARFSSEILLPFPNSNDLNGCEIKKQALSLGFFCILHGEYLLKQKIVVIKPPEWKFMAIIARNVKF